MNLPTTSNPALDSHSGLRMQSIQELFSLIGHELERVESRLADELSHENPAVMKLLGSCRRLAGKRLRPALVLLAGKSVGNLNADHVTLAAAIEMIHTATLVHDDILDAADTRRHAPTLNREHGTHAAVLTGDYLFSHAFYLTSTLPTTFAAREIGKATNRVCEGEMSQIGTQQEFDTTEEEYLQIIDAKTAELCACAMQIGAHSAGGSSDEIAAAREYGRRLGIAFQIIDDLLDILGKEEAVGKSLGTDLTQLKPTLPLIHFLGQMNNSEREEFVERLKRNEITADQFKNLLIESGSIEYSRAVAETQGDLARRALDGLPHSDATQILRSLPNFILSRDH